MPPFDYEHEHRFTEHEHEKVALTLRRDVARNDPARQCKLEMSALKKAQRGFADGAVAWHELMQTTSLDEIAGAI